MKTTPQRPSLLHGVFETALVAGALLVGLTGKLAIAEDSPEVPAFQKILAQASDLPFEIWFRGAPEDAPRAWTAWIQNLRLLAVHPLFEGRLPPLTSILIDPTWTLTAGYYVNTLRAPDDTPAILITPRAMSGNSQADSQLLVHELTHLIHDRMRPQEEAWVREGVALLAEYRVTGSRDPSMMEALREPDTSLVAELNLTSSTHYQNKASLPQYGHLAQYFDYIYRLCGKDTLLTNLLSSRSSATGIAFVDEVLRSSQAASPACQGFEASFERFEQARFMDSPYSAEGYVVHSPLPARLQASSHFALPPYSAGAYVLPTSGAHDCASGEVAWGLDRCIRIRMK